MVLSLITEDEMYLGFNKITEIVSFIRADNVIITSLKMVTLWNLT